MKLPQIGTVGRATVPAGIGRHGGRPYAKMAVFFGSDRTLAGRGGVHINDELSSSHTPGISVLQNLHLLPARLKVGME